MKKKVITIVLIVFVIGLIISFAYAALVQLIKGNGYAIVAKPIFEIEVQDANEEGNLYSYYNVIVKNYNADDEVSEVNFDYEVQITNTNDNEIPDYYWCDEVGNIIGQNLSGSLKHSEKEEKIYKICFFNAGNEDKTSNIKFKTTAEQKNDDEWIDSEITAISGFPTKETSNDVTLTIIGAQANGIELASEGYSFDGGITWQASNSKTFTENMTGIIIKVKDKNGKIYVHPELDINKINKT